ncbi:MAG: rolling circle replication-associated protein [Sarcina sp.]
MKKYNLKIISSGENRVEVYKASGYSIFINNESNNKDGRLGKEILNIEEKEENQERSRKTTLVNARNNIIRLIKSNEDMKTFITLTFNIDTNYKESKKYLQAMFLKLNRHYSEFKYLWVLEFGEKTDRIHYHMLCNLELPNIEFAASGKRKGKKHKEYENDFMEKYWKKGFVDIRALDKEGNSNIALYVSCYITKDLLDRQLEGYRIYGYSNKTLDKPQILNDYTNENLEDIIKYFQKDYEIIYSNSYEIGYKTDYKDRKGTMTYIDLKRKK